MSVVDGAQPTQRHSVEIVGHDVGGDQTGANRNRRGSLTSTDLWQGCGVHHVPLLPLSVTSSGSVRGPWHCSKYGNRPTFAN